MEIFLLRHGLAMERGTPGFADDAARPLTAKGKKQLKRVGRAFREMDLAVDLILTSPLLRARETAEIIADALQAGELLKNCEALKPDRSPAALIRTLQQLKPAPESVLLVGHEPFLSGLVSWLTTGGTALDMNFPKGGCCKLELEKCRVGKCARLAWLLTPKQMKFMVGKK